MPDARVSPLLLIEIGGTHTRCALAGVDHVPEHIVVFDNADHPHLESVVDAYLENPGVASPDRAALAVAAPVDTQPIHLTNLGWTLDTDRLRQRFGWSSATVVNDFEALACALPALSGKDLLSIKQGEPKSGAPMAVLGPGTGLGVSGLVPGGETWYPLSGEGGHVTLAAADDDEARVLRTLRRQYGHVSAERVLSGPGLLSLYRILGDERQADSPSDVSRLADAGDPQALETLDLFFRFLGTVSSDLALTLGARGGVYLGGGILPLTRAHLMRSGFQRRFTAKGRFAAYLERIPVHLIIADNPALRGIALHPDV